MRYTYGARIKRRRVFVRHLRFLQVYSRAALRTCNEKQGPTQLFRDVVAMESITRIRDLKVMLALFAANYHSGLWISCRPMCCGFRCLGMWISYRPKCCGPQHLGLYKIHMPKHRNCGFRSLGRWISYS